MGEAGQVPITCLSRLIINILYTTSRTKLKKKRIANETFK